VSDCDYFDGVSISNGSLYKLASNFSPKYSVQLGFHGEICCWEVLVLNMTERGQFQHVLSCSICTHGTVWQCLLLASTQLGCIGKKDG